MPQRKMARVKLWMNVVYVVVMESPKVLVIVPVMDQIWATTVTATA